MRSTQSLKFLKTWCISSSGYGTANKSELPSTSGVSPQTTNPLYRLRHALPLPSLAKKLSFFILKSSSFFPEKTSSSCIRHFAMAPKPEAELARSEEHTSELQSRENLV